VSASGAVFACMADTGLRVAKWWHGQLAGDY
jgi:hypothetical protein